MKLTKKIRYIIISTGIILFLVSLISFYSYEKNIKNKIILESIENNKIISEQVLTLTQMIEYSENFLLFLSELKIFKDYSNKQLSNNEFNEFLLSLMKYSEHYSQIRILKENGLEKFRINRTNNKINFINNNELQDKSKRYYYKELKKMKIGEIWKSYLDPNIENELMEIPINPTIRMGFKLKNSELFIINISLQKEFNNIKNSSFLQNKKKLFLETNSGTWNISTSEITYDNNIKNQNFYIKGFLNNNKLNTFDKKIFMNTLLENLQIIFILIFLIYLIFFNVFKHIYKRNYFSYIDMLTSCYNRNFFEFKIKKFKDLNEFNVAYVDIDNLKKINDSYGHDNGDILIKLITTEIQKSFSKDEFIVRIGGDEFLILSKENKEALSEKLNNILLKISHNKIHNIAASFSYGIGSDGTFEVSLKNAEINMYIMKKRKATQ